jgi:hypothetical protein
VEATPATTVTATVTPAPVIKYEYIEKVKEVTPQACRDAMDLMAQYLIVVSETGRIYGDGTRAAYAHDTAGLEAVSARLTTLKTKLDAVKYPMEISAAECRAKGK